MQEEGMQILRMLEDGKISAEDAARLLDALREVPAPQGAPQTGKRLRIRVTGRSPDKQMVNLTIPIALAKIAAKFVPPKAKQKMAGEGIDVDAVLSQVLAENVGKIIDVETEDEVVQISIE